MLENKWTRAAVFFIVAFGIPVLIGAYQGDITQGIQSGVVTGTIFAVLSQYFSPKTELRT